MLSQATPGSCQQEGLSRFNDDKRKPNGEIVASLKNGNREKTMSRRKRRPDKQQATGRAVEIQR